MGDINDRRATNATFSLEGTGEWPYDAYKLRAGEALDKLAAKGGEAAEFVSQGIQELTMLEPSVAVNALVWMVIQPHLQAMVKKNVAIMKTLAKYRDESRRPEDHSLLSNLELTVCLLAVVPGDEQEEITRVKEVLVGKMNEVEKFDIIMEKKFTPKTIARWACLASALNLHVQTGHVDGQFLQDCAITKIYLHWLKRPYPYKVYPCKSLSFMLDDPVAFSTIAVEVGLGELMAVKFDSAKMAELTAKYDDAMKGYEAEKAKVEAMPNNTDEEKVLRQTAEKELKKRKADAEKILPKGQVKAKLTELSFS